jgi:hydroxylamine reductase (hybrid-cluster protein)
MTIKGRKINGKVTAAVASLLVGWVGFVSYSSVEVKVLGIRQEKQETFVADKITAGLDAASMDRGRIVEKIAAQAIADKEWREQKLDFDRERWEQQQQWNNDAMIFLREIYRTMDKDK